MKRSFFLLLLFALPLIHAQNVLIGTTIDNPPFNAMADTKDHFFGFDIDIMGEICRRSKLNCQFKPLTFNDLFTTLKAGKIDFAIAGIIITANREHQFLFGLPYLNSTAQFMTLKNSRIKTPKDIIRKRVGVRLGTPFKTLASGLYKDQITIVEYPKVSDLLEGLSNGAVDVVLMDSLAAKNWLTNNSNLYNLVGSQLPVGNGYAIMTTPDQARLIAQMNQELLSMEADGTYLTLYKRYFINELNP